MGYQAIGADPEFDAQVMRWYSNTFQSGDGPMVLEHMLRELGFFDHYDPTNPETVLTPEDRVKQDYAKRILMWMGVWHEKNIRGMVGAITKLPAIIKGKAERSGGKKDAG